LNYPVTWTPAKTTPITL